MNLNQNRQNLIPTNWIHLNLTLSIRILMNQTLNRSNLIRSRWNLTPMIRIRNQQTRLQRSQFLPNKQIDKGKRGLRATKRTVNEGASSTPC